MVKKQYTSEYKAKTVIELLQENISASELASREGINVKQLYNWRKEFLEKSSRVFDESKKEKEANEKVTELLERERELMAKIGELTMENEFMKKKSAQIYRV